MASPFKHVLGTNYVPSDSEATNIREFCRLPQEKLRVLESKISSVQLTLDDLFNQRHEIHAVIDPHMALLSPIRRLSSEILQEIFFACLPHAENACISGKLAPLVLGWVCKRWREIALATSQLWTTLRIVAPHAQVHRNVTPAGISRQLAVINTWLSRSGSLPLTFCVESGWRESTGWSSQISQLLCSYSSRWQKLELKIPCTALSPFANLTSSDVPLLQVFALEEREHSIQGWPNYLHFLQNAPQLSTLSFWCSLSNIPLNSCRWEQLENLFVDITFGVLSISGDHVLDVLKRCTNLVMCRFKVFVPGGSNSFGPHANRDPVVLPHLLSLDIGAELSTEYILNLPHILDSLILPSLKHLSLAQGYYRIPSSPVFSSLHDLLQRSSCQLDFLALNYISVTQSELVSCLQTTPHLKKLDIFEFKDPWGVELRMLNQHALNALTIPVGSGGLCPNLTSLCYSGYQHFTDQALLDFLQSRCSTTLPGAVRLTDVTFTVFRPVAFDRQEVVRTWQAAGLRISIDDGAAGRAPFDNHT